MARFEKLLRLALLGLTLAFGSGQAFAQTQRHDYRIELDRGLSRMAVEARFAAPVTRIRAGSRRAARYIENTIRCDSGGELRVDGEELELPPDGITCLRYEVDFERAAGDERRNRGLDGRSVIVSPARWLWRPELDRQQSIHARFDLPPGIRVALPWRPAPGPGASFLLEASPESANAPAVFGVFDFHQLDIEPGEATLRVAVPGTDDPLDTETMLAWLEATARDVGLTYGRFPNPSPLVLVMPVSENRGQRSRGPVPFGRVVRNGGEAVELFVNPSEPLSAYLDDWTATHEFSHLMLPYLDREARWISEGFAQYYQNVLLARSGAYDETRAWQKIHAGLRRGQEAEPELSPNAAARNRTRGGRMKVYWAGAALALLADVELRHRSGGRASLDAALDRLQSCCLPSDRAWSGREFMAKLDELSEGTAVFLPLYERYADAPGFPDVGDTLARIGVRVDGDTTTLADDAILAATRRAITRTDPETARWRRGLAAD